MDSLSMMVEMTYLYTTVPFKELGSGHSKKEKRLSSRLLKVLKVCKQAT